MNTPARIKVTDAIAEFLYGKGIRHVFAVSGGADLHMLDSFDRHPGITPVFNHHEQAAAFAAQAYARVAEVPGTCVVTTGPGGTNALTGLLGAWLDSIPCIFISGQARLEHLSRNRGIRQRGVQEYDIVSLVAHMTKRATILEDAQDIHRVLADSYKTAVSGRPGPVWIDLPLNLQWAMVDPAPKTQPASADSAREQIDACCDDARRVCDLLMNSRRPLILAGYGIRLGNAVNEFKALQSRLGIPCIATWNASDIVPTDRLDFVGRPGVFGQRGANLAMQNCDLLLAVGSHLAIPVTGTQFNTFAREAKVVVVDVDPAEVKATSIKVDVPIIRDAKAFLAAMLEVNKLGGALAIEEWREKCADYKRKYNGITERRPENAVDPFVFVDRLSNWLNDGEVIVVDGGGTCNQIGFQTLRTKEGQRLVISGALCAMGSGLPESVGAAYASPGKNVICFCGDGSFQFNVQELQTIVHNNLPVKIFVFCNQGYLSIRQTQDGFFGGRYVGSAASGGMSIPDIARVTTAYGINTFAIDTHDDLESVIPRVLEWNGPAVCTLRIPPDSPVEPRIGFAKNPDGTMAAKPLEDMAPFLDRDEFHHAMIVKPVA